MVIAAPRAGKRLLADAGAGAARAGRRRAIGLAVGGALAAGGALAGWRLGAYGVGGATGRAADAVVVPPPRDAGAPDAAPTGVIAVLGTSLSARRAWPHALAQALQDCAAVKARAVVAARPGANSAWGLAQIETALFPPGATPDALIVEFAINDASLLRGLSLARSEATHRAILARAQAAQVPVFLATMNPAWGWNAWERPGLRAYHDVYRRLAGEGLAGLIDVAPAWRALSPQARATLAPDGLHPTDAGFATIAAPHFLRALEMLYCPQRAEQRGEGRNGD